MNIPQRLVALTTLIFLCFHVSAQSEGNSHSTTHTTSLQHLTTIKGLISPKSVVYSGNGHFFAQNMMYQHTVTVYNENFELVKTLSDKVDLAQYGQSAKPNLCKGSPVEVAFSPDGKYAWVSNYKMYGKGFDNPATDNSPIRSTYDSSFVYKINTINLQIEQIIHVGCVPKYVATTPDGKYVLVSNWSSGDLSVIDTKKDQEIRRIQLGRYPRGIVVDAKSQYAYLALMGEGNVACLNLKTWTLDWKVRVGKTPRHLCLEPKGKYLYISLSREGKIAKFDLQSKKVLAKVATGDAARSMVITPDGQAIYAVNYEDDTFVKVDPSTLKVLETHETNDKPIGITFDPDNGQVWVACYSGSLMVYKDKEWKSSPISRIARVNWQPVLFPN